jgi:hypothetical protein
VVECEDVGHELQAVVAGLALIEDLAGRFSKAMTVPLKAGLGVLPVSSEWLHEVGAGHAPGPRPYPDLASLTQPLAELLRQASVDGPIAYLEYEDFGDVSGEVAIVWSDGAVILPAAVQSPGSTIPAEGGPIDGALHLLGAGPGRDLVDSVGLTQFNRMDQWLEIPRILPRLAGMELVWTPSAYMLAGRDEYQTQVGNHTFDLKLDGVRCRLGWRGRTLRKLDRLPPTWEIRMPPNPTSLG